MSLAPHQLRVVAEKADLDDKVEKLAAFAKSPKWFDLPKAETARLALQLHLMTAYSLVLEQRINAFGEAA